MFNMESINGLAHKVKFAVSKKSPEILLVAGVTGVVVSTVLACKATLKVNDILVEANQTKDIIDETLKQSPKKYSDEDAAQDLRTVKVQTAVKVAKAYAPSVILGVLSIGSIVASHGVMKKKNMALAAAYATVDKGYKEFQERVAEKFGEDTVKELKYGIKAKEIETKEIDPETGEETITKETINSAMPSVYARFFDESSREYQKNPEYNLMFLRQTQKHANHLLRTRGHLYLNDVYDMLGFDRTKAGQIVGWKFREDNYIDFGIYTMWGGDYSKAQKAFINGDERSILLDFNVDGNIWSSLEE